jgi:hypothetical protein
MYLPVGPSLRFGAGTEFFRASMHGCRLPPALRTACPKAAVQSAHPLPVGSLRNRACTATNTSAAGHALASRT